MDLRNWEFYEDGNALVGATVKVRDALLTHPNAGTVLATTTTDTNGAWAFTGLTDTAKDVEVIWGNASQYHRWYKGASRHNLGVMFQDEPMRFREQASTPGAPGANAGLLWIGTDGKLHIREGAAGADRIVRDTGTTITTADITAGSISSLVQDSAGSLVTSSASYVDTGITVGVTAAAGDALLVTATGYCSNTAGGASNAIRLNVGGVAVQDLSVNTPAASYNAGYGMATRVLPSAGSVVAKIQFATNAGSLNLTGTLVIVQFRR
jgi:hypothetical protein